MLNQILVALDGSEHADRALDLACEIANRFDAELLALHVMSDKPLSDAERRMAQGNVRLMSQRLAEQAAATGGRFRRALGERFLESAARRAQENSVRRVRTLLQDGDPATAILRAADDAAADLIVLGRRGLGDLAGLLLGSVSHKVAHLCNCACLTVK